jgi:hypothetical protein
MSDNKITADFRPIKGVPSIRREDLRFKCVVSNAEDEKRLRFALLAKGYSMTYVNPGHSFRMCFISFREGKLFGNDALAFCSEKCPLVTYEQALDLIAQVEKPEPVPEFDIKPLQPVLWKQKPKIKGINDTVWHLDFYADRMNMFNFACVGNINADCLLPYNSNTATLNNDFYYPEGWWECKDGKPVWVSAK